MKTKLILITILLLAVSLFAISFGGEVKAGSSDNVSDYAWSENIGWISFNCTNSDTCGTVDYGVNVDVADGDMTGYAWSENIGWIDFNPSGSYPSSPNYSAKIDLDNGEASGWARVLAYGDGWDGWIKLRGSNYGVLVNQDTGAFSGYAWSDQVIGWISFSGSTYGVSVPPDIFNQAPVASVSCDSSECGTSGCYAFTGCPFHLNNDSTDPDGAEDIIKSEWDIYSWGSDPDLSCTSPALCNFTPQTSILTPATYTVELYVEDQKGVSDTTTIDFYLWQEAVAGFMCSLNNETWEVCEDISSLSIGEIIYFKDDLSLSEHSSPSQGASSITTRTWYINGDLFATDDTNPSLTLTETNNTIRLSVVDNQGRSDYQDNTIEATLPLPEWKEIAPFIRSTFNRFLASVVNIFR